MYGIVVQWKLSNGSFGSFDELDFRHEMQGQINDLFYPLGLGEVDGGQGGAGTMEVFIEDVPDLETALSALMKFLTDGEYLHMCKVVSHEYAEGSFFDGTRELVYNEDGEVIWTVHHPEGANFSFWSWD
jgi:hypothetical protein